MIAPAESIAAAARPQITLCLGAFNSAAWLPQVLAAAQKQLYDQIMLWDNASTDDTRAILTAFFPAVPITSHPQAEDRRANLVALRDYFYKNVTTPLLFMLDSDVVLPPGAITGALALLGSQVGAVGIPYPLKSGADAPCLHVLNGATLYRADLLRQVDWQHRIGCTCETTNIAIRRQGYQVLNHPTFRAEHLTVAQTAKSASPKC
jgi:glycosyltransferase involved in cell wall biosynthesis